MRRLAPEVDGCCAVIDPQGRLWSRDVGGRRYVVFSLEASSATAMPKAKPQLVVKLPNFDERHWIALSFDADVHVLDRGAPP